MKAMAAKLGGTLFWLAAAFPVMLASVLVLTVLTLGPLRAEDGADAGCAGRNLLADLKAGDPAKYAAIEAEADGVQNGRGIFWKIEKPGLRPSFILGTMHVTDPRVLAMPKGAAEASSAADTIIVESDEILDEKKAAAALLERPELTMFTDGSTISKYLSKADNQRLEAGLRQRGIPFAAVSRMRPWMISSVVTLPGCEIARKANGAQFLDQKLAVDAAAAGKTVKGLETLAEQLQAMADLPSEIHLKSLIETLELGSRMNDVIETMTELYLEGDIGATMPMLRLVTTDGKDDDSDYAAFEQRVILNRNKIMAERAAPTLAGGNVFMAVGALHLPGENGLIELLRKQGFAVTPVN